MFSHLPEVAPNMIKASYAPVTPAGKTGPFLVNTHLLQEDRKREVVGPVSCRATL